MTVGQMALTIVDRHPVMAFLTLVLAVILALLSVAIIAIANMELPSEEQAKRNPRWLSVVLFCKQVGPILVKVTKPLAGIFFTAASKAVLDAFLATNASGSTATTHTTGATVPPPPLPPPLPSLPEIPPVDLAETSPEIPSMRGPGGRRS